MDIRLIKNTITAIKKEYNSNEDVNEKYELIIELLKFANYIDISKRELFTYLGKNYELCEKCNKWYPIKDFNTDIVVNTYKDTPLNYPDDNDKISDLKIGDKEVELTYHICPVCKNKRIVKTVTTKYVFNGKTYNISQEMK